MALPAGGDSGEPDAPSLGPGPAGAVRHHRSPFHRHWRFAACAGCPGRALIRRAINPSARPAGRTTPCWRALRPHFQRPGTQVIDRAGSPSSARAAVTARRYSSSAASPWAGHRSKPPGRGRAWPGSRAGRRSALQHGPGLLGPQQQANEGRPGTGRLTAAVRRTRAGQREHTALRPGLSMRLARPPPAGRRYAARCSGCRRCGCRSTGRDRVAGQSTKTFRQAAMRSCAAGRAWPATTSRPGPWRGARDPVLHSAPRDATRECAGRGRRAPTICGTAPVRASRAFQHLDGTA